MGRVSWDDDEVINVAGNESVTNVSAFATRARSAARRAAAAAVHEQSHDGEASQAARRAADAAAEAEAAAADANARAQAGEHMGGGPWAHVAEEAARAATEAEEATKIVSVQKGESSPYVEAAKTAWRAASDARMAAAQMPNEKLATKVEEREARAVEASLTAYG
ncbi:hypothetical protein [Streptomyces sp. NBC_01578]|uniref:hypothetical protein n=1 Tax=Streptomyces sp. NBC_01578 TaxID=2975884 RepID=UPI00386828C9